MKNVFRFIVIVLSVTCNLCHTAAQESPQASAAPPAVIVSPGDSLRFMELIDLFNDNFKTEPEKAQSYADEMQRLAERTGDFRRLKKACETHVKLARLKGDLKEVAAYRQELLRQAEQLHYTRGIFDAGCDLINTYIDYGAFDMASPLINRCMAIAQQSNNDTLKAQITYSQAHYYQNTNAIRQSIACFRRSLKLFEKTGTAKDIANNRYFLAMALLDDGTSQDAVTQLTAALKTYTDNGDLFRQAQCRDLFARYYYYIGKLDYALDNLEMARSHYKEKNNQLEYAYSGIEAASYKLGREQTEGVAYYLEECESIFTTLESDEGLLQTMISWGDYYSQCRQFRKADGYFSRSWQKVQGKDDIIEKISLEQTISKHLQLQGRYRASDSMAFLYYRDLINTKEPEVILTEYRLSIQAGEPFTAGDSVLFSVLQQHGGRNQLQTYFNKKFRGQLFDSALIAAAKKSSFNQEKIKDSLAPFDERFNNLEARTNRDAFRQKANDMQQLAATSGRAQKNTMFVAIGLGLALLLLGLLLRLLFKRWRRSERDKARARQESDIIKAFQTQNNHLLQNNLRFFNLFLEHAKKKPDSGDTLVVLQNRLISIAKLLELIENKSDSNNNDINLGLFAHEVWLTLAHSLGIYGEVEADIKADVMLQGRQIILLGYILTELITNSGKYAFGNQQEKRITIRASEQHGFIHFSYRDNGSGMLEKYKQGQGIGLIQTFSLDLGGTYSWHNDGGTQFDLEFNPQHGNQ
jgi:two-component sensor histidine kinase